VKRDPPHFSLAAAVFGFLILTRRKASAVVVPDSIPVAAAKEQIKAEALKQGVDPRIALTFADLESRFQSGAVGDRTWPFRGDKWERFVRDNPRYSANQFRNQRDLWVSYGLFQLLSPFELWREEPNADPRILALPEVNARLGVAKIKRLQDEFGKDPLKIRIKYVCGSIRSCDPGKVLSIARKLANTAPKHGLDLGPTVEVVARAQALVNDPSLV
jgi:hypothetical protein